MPGQPGNAVLGQGAPQALEALKAKLQGAPNVGIPV